MRHPECLPGEVWLGNFSDPGDFASCGYASKRQGQVAYDRNGSPASGLYPIFVNRQEYKDATGREQSVVEEED